MVILDEVKLKHLRTSKNLSLKDVADVVNRKEQHISNYESGTAKPPADVLLTLLFTYGVIDFAAVKKISKQITF